jgi:hypothetical protein
MKFLNRVNKIHRYIVEDGQDNPQQNQPQAEQPQAPANPEPLSAEGEVMLVRLLKKALVIDIKPEDAETIQKMGDVNENNCRQVLNELITLIKLYSPVDINKI